MDRNSSRSSIVIWWALFSMALLCLTMACGERSTNSEGNGEGGGVVITSLVVVPSPVQEGRSSVVDLVVQDDTGQPLSGVEVSFSVSPTNIGHCSPAVDTTDANGSAGTVFNAASAGVAVIRAGITGVTSKTVPVEVVAQTVSTEPLTIEITPDVLPADGLSTGEIEVTVRDASGFLAEDGTVVKFTAGERFNDVDEDGYFTEGVDELTSDANQNGEWDPIGFIPLYAATTDGEVNVTYIAGFRTGTAHIKVTTELDGDLLQDDATLLLVPTDSVAYIVLMPDDPIVQVRGTGGVEATQVRAMLYDDNGSRVGKDFPVEFYIIYGPEGGEALNGVTGDSITVMTDSYGEAVVTLSSGTKSGVVKLRAKSGTVLSYSSIVTVCSGPPVDISVGVTPSNIRGWDEDCVEASVCACVVDIYGNPVPDSTSVHFGTEEGLVTCCDKTKQGCAYATYESGDPRNDGQALIWAETWGESGVIADTCLLIVSGPPISVNFLTYPEWLWADGVHKGQVRVEVLDINGNFVVDHTPVEMITDFGSIASGFTSDGRYASIYDTELLSQILTQDYSMAYDDKDDSVGVVNVLTAKSGVVSGSVNVDFVTGHTYRANCEIFVVSPVPRGATVPVEVMIKDAYGIPLGGHRIVADQAHTTGGTIVGSDYTNKFGQAVDFSFIATTDPNVTAGVISFCDEDARGGVCIAFEIQLAD
jgi:hypothetical protein